MTGMPVRGLANSASSVMPLDVEAAPALNPRPYTCTPSNITRPSTSRAK